MTDVVELALLAFTLLAQDPPPAPPPSTTASPPAAADRRAQRLVRVAAELEAECAAVAAFDREKEFAAALERGLAEVGGARWWKIGDGALPRWTLQNWLQWHRPQEGRELPGALDVALEGHPFGAIVDLAQQLAAHRIEFLFVCFPSRVECYPELVLPELAGPSIPANPADPAPASDRPPFRGMVGQNPRFLAELTKAGVEVVDLAPVFAEQRVAEGDERRRLLYLRGNTHWTPRGAELAANVVAARLAGMEWFEPGPSREGESFQIKRRLTIFRGEGVGQAIGEPSEPVAVDAVEPLGAPPDAAQARASPILLLGDSFCRVHVEQKASFADQLLRFTGWPIDVIAPNGGVELTCRDSFARRGDGAAGKKVVIWLMPEASLVPSGLFKKVEVLR